MQLWSPVVGYTYVNMQINTLERGIYTLRPLPVGVRLPWDKMMKHHVVDAGVDALLDDHGEVYLVRDNGRVGNTMLIHGKNNLVYLEVVHNIKAGKQITVSFNKTYYESQKIQWRPSKKKQMEMIDLYAAANLVREAYIHKAYAFEVIEKEYNVEKLELMEAITKTQDPRNQAVEDPFFTYQKVRAGETVSYHLYEQCKNELDVTDNKKVRQDMINLINLCVKGGLRFFER